MRTNFGIVRTAAAVLIAFAAAASGRASALDFASATAAELLAHADRNEVYGSISYEGSMLIEYQGKRFSKTFKAWGRADADSFFEFTNPEDRGTKYLKKDGRLYVYSPDAEEVMLISGHLLKESMMGSDLSYEDTIENDGLAARYDAAVRADEEVDGRAARVLELAAKKKTESYPKRKLWIDAATGDVLRSENYALSGAKLKEYRLVRAERIGDRRFPVEVEMRDLLRKGSRTVLTMENVELDGKIPDSVFSLRNLKK